MRCLVLGCATRCRGTESKRSLFCESTFIAWIEIEETWPRPGGHVFAIRFLPNLTKFRASQKLHGINTAGALSVGMAWLGKSQKSPRISYICGSNSAFPILVVTDTIRSAIDGGYHLSILCAYWTNFESPSGPFMSSDRYTALLY